MVRTTVAVITAGRSGDRVPIELHDSHVFETFPVRIGADLLDLLTKKTIDLAVLSSDEPDPQELLGVAATVRQAHCQIPLLLITGSSSESLAISALRAGITEYVRRPVSPTEFSMAVHDCLRRSRSRFEFQRAASPLTFGDMIGPGSAMREVRSYLGKLAMTDTGVLLTGETGTGKELAAKFIHERSGRSQKPLVNINCAAIPDTLLESELFGYERGAFTGANSAVQGKLKAADGGTVFLDEIGDMSSYAQAKILRAIENREVQRLGGSKGTPVDIRIIAATNQELEKLVEKGEFRRDLFFRLNVARVHLPALRERKEDIPALLVHYLDEMNQRYGRQVLRFTEDALDTLLAHEWPGNVRELKNLLEAIFVDITSAEIAISDFPPPFRQRCQAAGVRDLDERSRLLHALLSTNWNKSKAADKLNWSRMTLYRKIAKHKVHEAGNKDQQPGKRCTAMSGNA